MKLKILFLFTILLMSGAIINAQTAATESSGQQNSTQQLSPIDNISQEITKISKSLQIFNKNIKELLIKNADNKVDEKQQKLILGFEILNRAEERMQILQKFQIELVEKEATFRTRLGQIDIDLRPESIDRSTSFAGTTKPEELRDNRRQVLQAEKLSLQNVLTQIRNNLIETTNALKQTEMYVDTIRKKILPQIELEISNL